ncbi:citrate transporter [Euryarchaeota archaeon ex4484_178]|nr:MAG: citrate transporter [Euryarchaeota archaeon ex4484_178]
MVPTSISQIATLIIFIISYILIFSGKVDRTTAALFGVFLMLSAGYAFHFMTFEEALGHVDWEVILLLFGMMTFVGQLAKTGFFKYLGIKAIKLSGGKLWLLFVYLTLLTTFVSMVIDNVTTILLMIPLTVEVSEMLEISPVPLILGEAILSNIGGVATMIGDPPNILIAYASKYSFNAFIYHLFLPVLVSLFFSLLIGKFVYRGWLRRKPKNIERIMELDPAEYVKNEKLMHYLLIVLFFMILFFALQDYLHISPAFVALIGGTLSLVITMEDPKKAFEAVEWPTLVFFIALFMLVGGLEETGLLADLARALSSLSSDPLYTAILILWVSGITSSFVDNIPITAAFIPVVAVMTGTYHTGLLWWALAMGVGLGGNITPIGSSAGVISISLSRRYGYSITNKHWFSFGSLVAFVSMLVGTAFLFLLQYMG